MKLHNISVSLKSYYPDCVPLVIIKNCKLEISFILAELYSMCLKESCFADCRNFSSVVSVFKNLEERCTAKKYCLVSLLSVVSNICEKLVNLVIT